MEKPQPPSFHRVFISAPPHLHSAERIAASRLLLDAVFLRRKHIARLSCENAREPSVLFNSIKHSSISSSSIQCKNGMYSVTLQLDVHGQPSSSDSVFASPSPPSTKTITFDSPSIPELLADYHRLKTIVDNGAVITYCLHRLNFLDTKFKLHEGLNAEAEKKAGKGDKSDFFEAHKIDTHVHLAAAMSQRQLLGCVRDKAKNEGDIPVLKKDGQELTLDQIFELANLDPNSITLDSLDVHAGEDVFQRFDRFNAKYNPCGSGDLRSIFLKPDSNLVDGRYFAELTKACLDNLESAKSTCAEFRLSVYGRDRKEFNHLAKWVKKYDLYSRCNRWFIQVPRIYPVFRRTGSVANFQEFLDNIFVPIIEASLKPSEYPELAEFLANIGAFDSVDDESQRDAHVGPPFVPPSEWSSDINPPYWYYLAHTHAALGIVNQLRSTLGLNTFDLRPHSGESGTVSHLTIAYLTANNVNHGINLQQSYPLQYLYYLEQVGISVSPKSNNALFLEYSRSPFPEFFRRGLRVTLSTDDPLLFHLTNEPLVEEYAVAQQVFKLTLCSMSEIARNSVLISSFSIADKAAWVSPKFYEEGVEGNNPDCTNVPQIRVAYRHETRMIEFSLLSQYALVGADGDILPAAPGTEESAEMHAVVSDHLASVEKVAQLLENGIMFRSSSGAKMASPKLLQKIDSPKVLQKID